MPLSNEVKQAIDTAARRSADRAVRQTLLTLGIDVANAEAAKEHQKDMAFLRQVRTTSLTRSTLMWTAAFGTLMSALGGIATFLLTQWLKGVHLPW